MKRIFALLAIVLALFLAACGQTQPEATNDYNDYNGASENTAPLQVVATIFPQFDFVRQIAGDRVELSMLLSPGAESHGFEPTPRDIITLNNADLLVYVGGHGDEWVAPILASLDRQDMRTVALLDLVDVVMQAEGHHHHGHDYHHGHHHHDEDCDDYHHDKDCGDHNHDHGYHHHGHHHHDEDCDDEECDYHHHHDHHHDEDCDDHNHDHGYHHHGHHHHDEDCDDDECDYHDHHHHHHHHEHHYDEHVWTCPRNAIAIVRALTEVLSELDPANAYFFRENAETYIAQLEEVDHAFADVVATGIRTTVIFGDRFPFRYLTDTYGLTYFAAFTGCSAETQASPATIAFLIEKVEHENIPVVFHIEFSNRFIANTIAEPTGARLLELHSAHNVSHAEFTGGTTYLDLMWRNVEALREALN